MRPLTVGLSGALIVGLIGLAMIVLFSQWLVTAP
jgi:hypothetical protein